MNTYTYNETQIGMSESFNVKITEKMLSMFREISGDENPLHCVDEYALEKGYPGRVVYGLLTSSFYSTIAGMYLPGKRSLLHSLDIKLLKPVFVGDTLKIEGKITEKHDAFEIIFIKALITNQKGEKVSKATLQVGVSK